MKAATEWTGRALLDIGWRGEGVWHDEPKRSGFVWGCWTSLAAGIVESRKVDQMGLAAYGVVEPLEAGRGGCCRMNQRFFVCVCEVVDLWRREEGKLLNGPKRLGWGVVVGTLLMT